MLSRRQFLWSSATLAGGLAVGLSVRPAKRIVSRLTNATPLGALAWIEIDGNNRVTAYSSLTEMGQGVWSCIAQIVAEELDIDPAKIEIKMAPSWRAYAVPIGFFTGGSSSARRLYQSFRPIAAAARSLLIGSAAEQWQVSAAECHVQAGAVHHALTHRSLPYSSLNAVASTKSPPGNPLPTPPPWRWLGKDTGKSGVASLIDGSIRYGMDVQHPDMLVAAVAQSPLPGSVLLFFDRDAALAQTGVVKVVELPSPEPTSNRLGGGIAVVARYYWQAQRGLAAAKVRWQSTPVSTDELQSQLHACVAQDEQLNAKANSAKENQTKATLIDAIYEAPLLMHAQLEPLNATAAVTRFAAEVWAPTQAQGSMQVDIAKALGLWRQAVVVHTPRVGGGFGRRLATDYGVTAAQIAREFDVPVKSIWSREEDSTQGRFRPMSAARITASLDTRGRVVRWEALVASLGEYPRIGGLTKTPYEIPQQICRYLPQQSTIRTGSWRSVDASQNVFFRECLLDECAEAAKIDPLEYRRMHLAGNARALRVLDRLATLSDYANARFAKRFLGVAFSEENGSITAQAAEAVQVSNGQWRIARVVAVVDCGVALNPNNIRAQLEGGILFGLSAALAEEVTYVDGELQQRNYDRYRVLTIDATPDIQVEILETSDADIGGIGEVGVPLIAPAAANALFAATGIRVRRLPLTKSNLPLDYK